MKALFTIFFVSISFFTLAQPAPALSEGAYQNKIADTHHLWIFQDQYFSAIEYSDTHFVRTWGGPYTFENKALKIQVEYDTQDENNIGKTENIPVVVEKKGLKAAQGLWKKEKTIRQDLDGLWRITGRKQENSTEIGSIHKGDRKTIKILSDGYFQWIAINPAEKGFYGTGGGKYTFKNGVYTEEILFFSRDDSRVGHTLTFEGKLENKNSWHHSGLSSKGDPIYEIWDREQ